MSDDLTQHIAACGRCGRTHHKVAMRCVDCVQDATTTLYELDRLRDRVGYLADELAEAKQDIEEAVERLSVDDPETVDQRFALAQRLADRWDVEG